MLKLKDFKLGERLLIRTNRNYDQYSEAAIVGIPKSMYIEYRFVGIKNDKFSISDIKHIKKSHTTIELSGNIDDYDGYLAYNNTYDLVKRIEEYSGQKCMDCGIDYNHLKVEGEIRCGFCKMIKKMM